MGRFLKFTAIAAAALVTLLIVAAILFALLFDANDFRDEIEAGVEQATGRELTIAGDIGLSILPWFAIDMQRVELGNAPGFGAEPFASFDSVRFSIRVLPLILGREITIGTAAIDSLRVNLAVDENGRTNWEDLTATTDEPVETAPEQATGTTAAIDVASIEITDAAISYTDAQAGTRYSITDLELSSGRVGIGEPVALSGGLSFDLQPDDIRGGLELELTVDFDPDAGRIDITGLAVDGRTEGVVEVPVELRFAAPAIGIDTGNQRLDAGGLELTVLDIDITAEVEPFSYAGSPNIATTLAVAAFSPKSLLQTLALDVPETADPDALERLAVDAKASIGEAGIELGDLTLVLDDSTFTGRLSLPTDPEGRIEAELTGDRIDITRYMAPGSEAEQTEEAAAAPVEIPVDLIRQLNARASFALAKVLFGRMEFDNIEVVANVADDRLRIHPIAADFYGGGYRGDINIDASGDVPALSVNETIADVSLTPLVQALFERDNVTGSINGNFQLAGSGEDIDAIRRDLDGSMRFEFSDAAWQGTDIWHEIRRARALFRGEPAPAARTPVRTEFTSLRASGVVNDGVMTSDDLFAELPYMQITGGGTVNFVAATIDYALRGRVLERPEFVDASGDELDEYTEAVIPFRIDGPLAGPGVSLDFGALVRERAEQELDRAKDRLIDELLGGDEGETDAEGAQDPEDAARDLLKDLLRR